MGVGQTTPDNSTEKTVPPHIKEQRKREREKKKLERSNKLQRGDGADVSGAKKGLSAWPARPNMPGPDFQKLREGVKQKFPDHCHAYLIGAEGCTRKGCKHGKHAPPDQWQEFIKSAGF